MARPGGDANLELVIGLKTAHAFATEAIE